MLASKLDFCSYVNIPSKWNNCVVTDIVCWSQVNCSWCQLLLFFLHLFVNGKNLICVLCSWSTWIPLPVCTSGSSILGWLHIRSAGWVVSRHPSNDISGGIAVLRWCTDRLVISNYITCRQYPGYDRCVVRYCGNARHRQTIEWTSCADGRMYGFRWGVCLLIFVACVGCKQISEIRFLYRISRLIAHSDI